MWHLTPLPSSLQQGSHCCLFGATGLSLDFRPLGCLEISSISGVQEQIEFCRLSSFSLLSVWDQHYLKISHHLVEMELLYPMIFGFERHLLRPTKPKPGIIGSVQESVGCGQLGSVTKVRPFLLLPSFLYPREFYLFAQHRVMRFCSFPPNMGRFPSLSLHKVRGFWPLFSAFGPGD